MIYYIIYFRRECYNLTWSQLEKILVELDRIRQTQQAHDDSEASPAKAQKSKVESIRWVVEDGSKTIVRKSKDVYLSMKNCLAAGQKQVLKSKERINYVSTDLYVNEDDLINKVCYYYLREDYSDISRKKCVGCQSKEAEVEHDLFCLMAPIPIVNSEIGHKAFAKISGKRILKGCLTLSHLFGLAKTLFSLSKCNVYVEEFDKFEYDEFLECKFEYEMNLLDD